MTLKIHEVFVVAKHIDGESAVGKAEVHCLRSSTDAVLSDDYLPGEGRHLSCFYDIARVGTNELCIQDAVLSQHHFDKDRPF